MGSVSLLQSSLGVALLYFPTMLISFLSVVTISACWSRVSASAIPSKLECFDSQDRKMDCDNAFGFTNAAPGYYVKYSFGKLEPIAKFRISYLSNKGGSKIYRAKMDFGHGDVRRFATFNAGPVTVGIPASPPICTTSVTYSPLDYGKTGPKITGITFERPPGDYKCGPEIPKAGYGMKKLDLSKMYCLSAPIINRRFMCQNAFDGDLGTRWATNRGSWSWITVFLKKRMRVAQVAYVDKDEIVTEVSVRTFHYFTKIKLKKSVGMATIPTSRRLPTVTVETKVRGVKQWKNAGFNEIMVWIVG